MDPQGNLFADVPPHLLAELFETLWRTPHLKLERIVSRGHATPPGQWYDQETDEWVVLLKGSAELRVEGQEGIIKLKPGDYLVLPARVRHRVESTAAEEETVWLAIHAR